MRKERQAEEEGGEPSHEEDEEMVVSPNHLFKRVSEDEEEEHVSEKVEGAGVYEESRHKGPDTARREIVVAEDEILFRVYRVCCLRPGPETGPDAAEYE